MKTTATGRPDADLETIIGKCLEKDPERRYGSAAELAEDMERYLNSRPILARPQSALYQLRKLVARHRPAFAISGVVLAFLLVFAVMVTIEREVQRRERARADVQARKADQVARFMGDAFQGTLKELGKDATVRAALDRARQRVDQGRIGGLEGDAEIRLVVGNAYTLVGDGETAERLIRSSIALLERQLGPRDAAVADALQSLGVNLYYRGRLEEAASLAQRVLAIHEAQSSPNGESIADDLSLLGSIQKQQRHLDSAEASFRREMTLREPRYALILKHNLANVLLLQGRTGEARHVLDEALELEIGEGDAPMIAFDQASVSCAQGRHAEAERWFREAVEGERRLSGLKGPNAARALVGLGRCLGHLRRFPQSEDSLRQAAALQKEITRLLPLDARATGELASLLLLEHDPVRAWALAVETFDADRETFGDESFVVARDWARLGRIEEALGRWNEAEEAHRQSLTLRERILAPDDVEIGSALSGLAAFLSQRGRFAEAAPLHLRALDLFKGRFDVPMPDLAMAKGAWARTLDGLERYTEADMVRGEALKLARSTIGDETAAVAELLHDRAVSLHRQHHLDEAARTAGEAVVRRRELLDASDPDLAASLLEMGRIQAESGEHEKARTAAREALAIWSKAVFVEPTDLQCARRLASPHRIAAGYADAPARRAHR